MPDIDTSPIMFKEKATARRPGGQARAMGLLMFIVPLRGAEAPLEGGR